MPCGVFSLPLVAALLALLLALLALLLTLLLVLLLILLIGIHGRILPYWFYAVFRRGSMPRGRGIIQLLSLGLKITLHKRPAVTAAVMPPAAAFSPPVKMPRKPSS